MAVLLYVHSSVLAAIAISMFWSLLNERVDPHAAKPLMARVSGWNEIRRAPLLRDLALVVTLAAVLAAFVDYVLKAEAVAYFGKAEPLVRGSTAIRQSNDRGL